jgi:cell division protein FtsB
MSAVIKPRKIRKVPAATPALWLVLGLAAVFFLVRYGQELLMEHDLNSKIAVQRSANSALADENARLAAALVYYQSDKYVEQRAREDLNLRRSDEEVLIPVGDTSQASTPSDQPTTAATAVQPAAQTADEPNWMKWLGLFSPFGSSP